MPDEINRQPVSTGGDAVDMGEGMMAIMVTGKQGESSMEEMRQLLVEIKAELVTLNASINAGISVSIG